MNHTALPRPTNQMCAFGRDGHTKDVACPERATPGKSYCTAHTAKAMRRVLGPAQPKGDG